MEAMDGEECEGEQGEFECVFHGVFSFVVFVSVIRGNRGECRSKACDRRIRIFRARHP
jgi:hypothetical protein